MALTEVNNRSAFSNVQRDTWGGADERRATIRTTCGAPTPCASTSTTSPAAAIRTCSTSSSPSTSRPCARHRGRAAGNDRRVPGAARTSRPTAAPRKNRRAPTCSSARRSTLAMPIQVRGRRALREDRRDLAARWCRRRPASTGSRTTSSRSSLRQALRTSRRWKASTTTCCRALDFAFDLTRQHEAARQLRRDHRPSGLGRHPGRTDAQPAGAHQRRHRHAGQSGPEAARVEELSTCRSSGTTPRQLPVGGLLQARTSTTTSASPPITETPFDLPHPGQGAYFNEAVADGCPTGDLDLHPQLHLRQPRRRSGRDGDGRGFERQSHRHHRRTAGRSDRDLRRSRCRRTSRSPSSMAGNSTCSTCSATAASACRRTTRWSIRT